MLETVNISLPKPLSVKVDEVVEKEGYASRSEFFRTLLRFYLQFASKPAQKRVVFSPFQKKPLDQIEGALAKTGNYNPKFVQSVVAGLSKSSLYQDEN